MPIEFRCEQCNKLLRTGDDTAGKQAKCPECGAVMTVPSPESHTAPYAQPAGQFEAIASPFGTTPAQPTPDSTNPYQSPTGVEAPQVAVAPAGEIRPTRLDFNDTFARTWAIFTERWLPVLAAQAILFGVSMAIGMVSQVVTIAVGAAVQDKAIIFGVTMAFQLIGSFVQIWLNIGVFIFLLSVIRGEEPRYSLIFNGGPYLLSLILCVVLMMLLIVAPGGLAAGVCLLAGTPLWMALAAFIVLFLIPGTIPFMFMFLFAPVLIIDRNMGVMEALTTSREVMAGNKLTLFLIYLVASAAAIVIGLLTCLTGLIVYQYIYAPILFIVIYLTVTGQPTMVDHYAAPLEESGDSPFGQPAPGGPGGTSPFAS